MDTSGNILNIIYLNIIYSNQGINFSKWQYKCWHQNPQHSRRQPVSEHEEQQQDGCYEQTARNSRDQQPNCQSCTWRHRTYDISVVLVVTDGTNDDAESKRVHLPSTLFKRTGKESHLQVGEGVVHHVHAHGVQVRNLLRSHSSRHHTHNSHSSHHRSHHGNR